MCQPDPTADKKRALTRLTILLASRLRVEIEPGDVEEMIRRDWNKLTQMAHAVHDLVKEPLLTFDARAQSAKRLQDANI